MPLQRAWPSPGSIADPHFCSAQNRQNLRSGRFYLPADCGFFEEDFSRQKELYLELILSPGEAASGGDFPIDVPVFEECSVCSGAGFWRSFICSTCSGFGQVRAHRTFVLHVPACVKHGAEARISLEGIGLKNVFINVEIILQKKLI